MHIAKVNVWCCVSPIARIFQFKAHFLHIISYLFVVYRLTINKGLLCNNFEFITLITAKT